MLQYLGSLVRKKVSHAFYAIGYVGRVLVSSFHFLLRGKASYKVFIMQLLFTFVDALSLVVVIGLAIGSVILGIAILENRQ